jgi:hypothetical protein
MEPMDISSSNSKLQPTKENPDPESLQEASAEMKALQEENRGLKVQLNACKSMLLSQSGDEGASDVTIQNDFEHICHSIENWINALERCERKGYFKRKFQDMWSQGPDVIDKLEFYQVGENFEGKSRRKGIHKTRWMRWLRDQDTSNCIVLSVIIWHFLESNIFDREFPVGIPEETTTILSRVLKEISASEYGQGERFPPPSRRGSE